MPAPIEHAVEIHWIQFPSCSHRRYIFVQSSDESYMSRSRLCRDSSMRDAKGAVLEDARAYEGGEGSGGEVRIVFWIWFRE